MGLFDLFKEKSKDTAEESEKRFPTKELKANPEMVPSEERYALALAAPYRSIFIYTPEKVYSPHMYALGMLDEKDKKEFSKAMKNSFNIVDAESMMVIMSNIELSSYEDDSIKTFAISVELHQLLACVELGYIKWEDFKDDIAEMVQDISGRYKSWKEFAEDFYKGYEMNGESSQEDKTMILNKLRWLSKSEVSPWSALNWNEM